MKLSFYNVNNINYSNISIYSNQRECIGYTFFSSFSNGLVLNYIKQVQGFFVECCGTSLFPAAREQSSNIRRPFSSTIHLETFWDWSGILIHSHPDKIDLIRTNQKNVNSKKLAEALPICLNLHDDPKSINSAVRLSKHTYILFIFTLQDAT